MKSLSDFMGEEYEKRLNEISKSAKVDKANLEDIDSYVSNLKSKLKNRFIFGIEKNIVGKRVFFHKSDSCCKFFSMGEEDITSEINGDLVKVLKDCEQDKFIIDCVLNDKNGKDVLYAYDVLMFDGKDISSKPWNERKRLLRKITGSESLKEIPMVVVKNKKEFEEAVNMMSKFSDSTGVSIKNYVGEYVFGDYTDDWLELELKKNGKINTQ